MALMTSRSPPLPGEEPQDSDRQRRRRKHGPDHPADEPCFKARDFGPHLRDLGTDASDSGLLLGAQFGDLCREPRIQVRDLRPDLGNLSSQFGAQFGDLGPDLGVTGLELVWRDVSPCSVNSRRASAWAGVKSAAVSDRATACVSSISRILP